MESEIAPPIERYRPNVAIILLDRNDKILVCERIDEDGAWQFPQGGVDQNEDPTKALLREVEEEIGLMPKDYKIIEFRDGYKYKYPAGVREKKKKKHGIVGQEQTYFLCKLKKDASEIDINTKSPEFQNYTYIKPEKFNLEWLPKFKHEVYAAVLNDFFNCKAEGSKASPLK